MDLSWEAVDRWRLKRHHLVTPAGPGALEAVAKDLIGVHAQVASAAKLAFRARVDGVTPGEVRAAIRETRTLVKTWAMRGTLHLFSSADFPDVVAALRTKTQWRREAWLRWYGLTLAQMEALLAAIPEALDGRCLTREELADELVRQIGHDHRERLLSGWGSFLKPAAHQGLLCFGPSQGQRVTFARPDRWLPGWREPAEDPDEALATVARRFLHAYGPATPEEFGRWWGFVPGPAKRLFQRLGEEVVEVTVEGRRAWAHGEDAEAIAAAGVPPREPHVRLLGLFDPYVVAYQPRARFVPAAHVARVYRTAGWISAVVLVDGLVAGVWEHERRGARLAVNVRPFTKPSRAVARRIRAEADDIGRFLGLPTDVDVEPPS